MTLNFKKSKFFRDEIDFLGHRITKNGIHPQPEKIEAIKQFPMPRNAQQLKGFLGLTNYYIKFTSAYSNATYPLLSLLRKGAKWDWTEEMKTHFTTVKNLFCETMIIYHQDPEKRYYLQCDASNYALGAVLYQLSENDEERIVGFASRTIKGAELNYFTSEKELLAIVFALEKFRTFIVGAKLTIWTDHKALTFLFTCKLVSSRLARCVLFIQTYDFEIEYIKGTDNIVADVLSRYPPEQNQEQDSIGQLGIAAPLAKKIDKQLSRYLKDYATHQRNDRRINELLNSDDLKSNKGLVISDNVLYRREPGGRLRAYVPEELVKKLIVECHELYGHIGANKCYKLLKEGFYYPKFAKRIRQTLASCDKCHRRQVPNRYSL